jgi:hypothetical protein
MLTTTPDWAASSPARPLAAVQPRLSSVALAIFGFCWNSRIALRIILAASACGTEEPSASRRRRIARAWSCETRDSLTPISAPICFIVASA